MTRAWLAAAVVVVAACAGQGEPVQPSPTATNGPATAHDDATLPLDKARARDRFQATTDLMRWVIAPGCAAQHNECHQNEDFPDMSTEGNLWNLVDQPCNQGVGDRTTVEDFCEQKADELRVDGGPTVRVGSIATLTNDAGEFDRYEVRVDVPLAAPLDGASFVVVRDGAELPAVGHGSSLRGDAGSKVLGIVEPADLPDPRLVRQGDENDNGVFGTGEGVLVRRGDAHASYLVRRLLGKETTREQMPLNANSDNPTEINNAPPPDAMYALLSWINCMGPSDGPYSPIRYDCEANADNEGTW